MAPAVTGERMLEEVNDKECIGVNLTAAEDLFCHTDKTEGDHC